MVTNRKAPRVQGGIARRLLPEIPLINSRRFNEKKSYPFWYCSSLTCSIQSTTFPSFLS